MGEAGSWKMLAFAPYFLVMKNALLIFICFLGMIASLEASTDSYPLHAAVQQGKPTRVRALVRYDNVNSRDGSGLTPLMLAAMHDRATSASILINAGASVDAVTASYSTTALMLAAKEGHHEVVEVLLRSGADINARNKSGFTALMLASYHGQAHVVSQLLQAGADAHLLDASNRTALVLATTEEVRRILQAVPGSSSSSNYPLHAAVKQGKPSRVRALVNYGNVNSRDGSGLTPLMLAAMHDRDTSASILINAGASVDAVTADHSTTALMLAAKNGYQAVVEVLLRGGADVNARDKSGFTALMWASNVGHAHVVSQLLQAGADAHLLDASNRTALSLAATEEVRRILQAVPGTSSASHPSGDAFSPEWPLPLNESAQKFPLSF